MKLLRLPLIALSIVLMSFGTGIIQNRDSQRERFNAETDLLLVQFDCKTDVDDLHTAAAFAMLMADSTFSKINYHAVAGTYGIQKGLYVPPNNLFDLAFKNNWTDAHENTMKAVEKVKMIAMSIFAKNGDLWIAEAGQSDFTAKLIQVIQTEMPKVNTSQRIHVVQHSNWNEKMTSPESLQFVKANADYQKIPDGNAVGNGTPGFRDPEFSSCHEIIKDANLYEIWQLAVDLGNKYNGKDGRYNNKAVSEGGLDFSDLSEVCWILGLEDIKDTEQFFNLYSN